MYEIDRMTLHTCSCQLLAALLSKAPYFPSAAFLRTTSGQLGPGMRDPEHEGNARSRIRSFCYTR